MALPGLPLRIQWVKGDPVPLEPDKCEPHMESPDGYLQWHAWADRMEKTHVQRQCKGCGLWSIWEPKEQAMRPGLVKDPESPFLPEAPAAGIPDAPGE